MSATELLLRVRALGISLRLDGEDLVLSPARAVPDELRTALAEKKREVVVLLHRVPPVDGRLLEGGRVWIPPPPRAGWCPCDQDRAFDPETGLCRTCAAVVTVVRQRAAADVGPSGEAGGR